MLGTHGTCLRESEIGPYRVVHSRTSCPIAWAASMGSAYSQTPLEGLLAAPRRPMAAAAADPRPTRRRPPPPHILTNRQVLPNLATGHWTAAETLRTCGKAPTHLPRRSRTLKRMDTCIVQACCVFVSNSPLEHDPELGGTALRGTQRISGSGSRTTARGCSATLVDEGCQAGTSRTHRAFCQHWDHHGCAPAAEERSAASQLSALPPADALDHACRGCDQRDEKGVCDRRSPAPRAAARQHRGPG
jgi:hypothetical protein